LIVNISLVIARSACDEAIQSLLVALDCFADARNDGGVSGLFENGIGTIRNKSLLRLSSDCVFDPRFNVA
jgi:hypothetical protein